MTQPLIRVQNLAKSFHLHLQGGQTLPALRDLSFELNRGECVILGGPSGAGKSSILKILYGNYLADQGKILFAGADGALDLVTATPRQMLHLRRFHFGYVSQFLRVIPRVSALDIVAAPAKARGISEPEALARARDLLHRLNLPQKLWSLPPSTFSGGEQQRVNIAHGLSGDHPVLLLDEPTASLDATNRAAVVSLIEERKARGTAILGIFHDEDVRDSVADRVIQVQPLSNGEAHG